MLRELTTAHELYDLFQTNSPAKWESIFNDVKREIIEHVGALVGPDFQIPGQINMFDKLEGDKNED